MLQNGTKFQKKEVYKELNNFIQNNTPEDVKLVFEKMLNAISISFQDKVEMCRENAIDTCINALNLLEPHVNYLLTLVPSIHHRLCSEVILEPSEELRLKYIELVLLLIRRHNDLVVPYFSELVEILVKTVLDTAPDVKKKRCVCVIQLAEIGSSEFHPYSKNLILTLFEAVTHQHWRVRFPVIQSMVNILILIFHFS